MKLIRSKDYPEVNANLIEFPKEIYIAYAVCNIKCGNTEFIVDGQTQVCERCNSQLFRTDVKKYFLAKDQDEFSSSLQQIIPGKPLKLTGFDDDSIIYPQVVSGSIRFPCKILITYAVCRKDCGNAGLIVEGSTDICEYCGRHMLHTYIKKYVLAQDLNLR
ncbi:MAG TPA: hypothetical protein DEB10_05125 [Ruminococcaceae bacterium]|nr:hypothetical protein [Oscillospiraceae bacterium]